MQGGVEVTILGENFARGLVCVFGDTPAMGTQFWSSNTLVCILPPSPHPGPVVVGFKGLPIRVETGGSKALQFFTYLDTSDRSLMELALQVVGLKMTGKIEDARNVAMRIIGGTQSPQLEPSTTGSGSYESGNTASLANTLNSAVESVYSTPAPSRAVSPRSSTTHLPSSSVAAFSFASTATRGFEGTILKFLSLLDLDTSEIPGSAPHFTVANDPISFCNQQRHTLLHLASILGFHRLVAFLLVHDIDLNAQDRNGFTALHFACLSGRVAIARALLEAGAASFIRNEMGKTPLDLAIEADEIDIAALFPSRPPSFVSSRPLSRTPSFVIQRRRCQSLSTDEVGDDDESSYEEDDGSYPSSDLESGISRNASFTSLPASAEVVEDEALADDEDDDVAETHPITSDDEQTVVGDASPNMFAASQAWISKAAPYLKPSLPSLNIRPGWDKVSFATLREMHGFQSADPRTWVYGVRRPRDAVPETVVPAAAGKTDEAEWTPEQWEGIIHSTADSDRPPQVPPKPSSLEYESKVAKRVGFIPTKLTDRTVRSYGRHTERYRTLKRDKMLYLFCQFDFF
jgi:hypothetical protein